VGTVVQRVGLVDSDAALTFGWLLKHDVEFDWTRCDTCSTRRRCYKDKIELVSR